MNQVTLTLPLNSGQEERGVKGTTKETTKETANKTTRESILGIISDNPQATALDMAYILGLSADGVRYHLNKMKADGLIKRVGPTKGGYWEITEEKNAY